MNLIQHLIFIQNYIFEIAKCYSTNGVQQVYSWGSPCECKGSKCQKGQYCNEEFSIKSFSFDNNQCRSIQSINLDQVSMIGYFTFDNLVLTERHQNGYSQIDGNRVVDKEFDFIGSIHNSKMAVNDVGNGTFWVISSEKPCAKFKQAQGCNDVIVQLRSSKGGLILKEHWINSLSKHEIRTGNHPLEAVLIRTQKYPHPNSKNMKYIQGLVIVDFSHDPPTEREINPVEEFDPDLDWGSQSNEKQQKTHMMDWMHLNSAGVDLDGNYWMSGRNGSFWTLWDKDTLQRIQTIASEFRSDQTFPDVNDRMQNQHDMQQLASGHWLTLDNGLKRPMEEGGEYSRCIEQELDHQRKTVTKVWEYRPGLFCSQAGSCRRLPNGNTLMMFSNCVKVNTPPLIDGPSGPDDLIENQVVEVDKNGMELGRATIPYAPNQIMQRAVPNFAFEPGKETERQSDVLMWNQIIGFICACILFCMLMQQVLLKKNVREEREKERSGLEYADLSVD